MSMIDRRSLQSAFGCTFLRTKHELYTQCVEADVGERMIYMRKRQGESTPLKREALYLYEGGYVLLTQRRCERPNDKEFEYIATRTKKAAKKVAA